MEKATFIARGSNTVNDYIVISSGISCVPGTYDVLESYDTANRADDHLMVCAEVLLIPNFSRSFQRRRVVNYDRGGYLDPIKAAYFNQLILQFPPIPFNVDHSSNCFLLQEWVRNAAEKAFPKPLVCKRNGIRADDTFALILARGRLRKRFRLAGRGISNLISKTISHYTFRAWAIVVNSEPNQLVDFFA